MIVIRSNNLDMMFKLIPVSYTIFICFIDQIDDKLI